MNNIRELTEHANSKAKSRRSERDGSDRDVKSKARSRSKASTPGAESAPASKDVASSGKSRAATHRTRDSSDRNAKNRAKRSRSNDGASVPGPDSVSASKEVAITRTRESDRNAKSRAKGSRSNNVAPAVPGAQSSSGGDCAAERKQSRNKSNTIREQSGKSHAVRERRERERKKGNSSGRSHTTSVSSDDTIEAPGNAATIEPMTATAVNEEEDERTRALEVERLKYAALRRQMSENRFREEERRHLERMERKKKNLIIAVVLIAALIGGGVAVFFALNKGGSSPSSSDPSTINPETNSTPQPGVDAPNGELLKYDSPSIEDCKKIADGEQLDGQEYLPTANFDVFMDVELFVDLDMTALLSILREQIRSILLPQLAGCSSIVEEQNGLRRREKALTDLDHEIADHRGSSRSLEEGSIRYVIANGLVTVTLDESLDCKASGSDPCHVVMVQLNLSLFGMETFISIISIISEVFVDGNELKDRLLLGAPFKAVTVTKIDPSDASITEPSSSPSEAPSVGPSLYPTQTPSIRPSRAPASTQVTTEPSTNSPSASPSLVPTIMPTVPDATPAPTAVATHVPSLVPSLAPSSHPTTAPTQFPTIMPVPDATPTPTAVATPVPTPPPSSVPSSAPSSVPSPIPSISPSTEQPSQTPSFVPSVPPSALPSIAPLGDDLYCGCTLENEGATSRTLSHVGPNDLSQQDCILYCRSENFKFAGLQAGNACYCGDSTNVGASNDCSMECPLQGPGNCYGNVANCKCGNTSANTLFRTSSTAGISCPTTASILRSDYATAGFGYQDRETNAISTSFDIPGYQDDKYPASNAIDGNTYTFAHSAGEEAPEYIVQYPILQVDLGFPASITSITIFNRHHSCCWYRTEGTELEILDADQTLIPGSERVLTLGGVDLDLPRWETLTFSSGIVSGARYIRLRGKTPEIAEPTWFVLNIGEIIVHGQAQA